ncbi:serine hydrolase [Streptomyces thermospinosisporus]|uniref:serine hydrolase n=1 Tax=Streptomyces thermospinosisporus TaxID=161482 RepID=UPI003CD06D5A
MDRADATDAPGSADNGGWRAASGTAGRATAPTGRKAPGEADAEAADAGAKGATDAKDSAEAKNAKGDNDATGAPGSADNGGWRAASGTAGRATTPTGRKAPGEADAEAADAAAKGATDAKDSAEAKNAKGDNDATGAPGSADNGGWRAASGTAGRATTPTGRKAPGEADAEAADAAAKSATDAKNAGPDNDAKGAPGADRTGAKDAPLADRTGAKDATPARDDASGKAKAAGRDVEAKAKSERDEDGGPKGALDQSSGSPGAPAPNGTPAQGTRSSAAPAPNGTPGKGGGVAEGKGSPKGDSGGKGGGADKAKAGDAAKGDPKGDSSGKGGKAERPVDQPTAVFKTVRSGPALDQATTMLRVDRSDQSQAERASKPEQKPDQRPDQKPESKPQSGSKPGSGSGAGAESERTSKFVALKSLDDPGVRKPARAEPSAAEATTALPQIGPERTAQQPLPPKPPLDLLAELTNTPPPPDTPLRTAVRRVKIWTPLVLLLVIIFAVAQAVRPLPEPTLTVTAEPYVFEGDKVRLPWPGEGQGWMHVDGVGSMDHFGEQKPVAIGSVAKTMTAYVILRDHPLKPGEEGPKIEIDETAEKEGGYNKDGESTLDTVKAGDKLTLKQALSAVMIPSANNIARLLARWDAGSEAAFVKKMNDTAKELGMSDTRYTDPSGLKETTVSTAEDQVKLGRAVVKNPALVAITSAASWTDPSGKYWTNYNELPYRMGAIGIKTGSTTKAGGNLLFASREEVDGRTVTVVGAILGQHKPKILETANRVSQTALEAAEDALISAKVVKKGTVVGYVDDQLGGRTPVVVTKDVSAVGWAGLKVKMSFAPGSVPHSAEAGTEVGTLTVGDGSSSAVKVPVALKEDLVEPGFTDKLTRIA